jgi:hypothetical protein
MIILIAFLGIYKGVEMCHQSSGGWGRSPFI